MNWHQVSPLAMNLFCHYSETRYVVYPYMPMRKKFLSRVLWCIPLHETYTNFSTGIGHPHPAERVEKKMVERDEGLHIAVSGNTVNDEWDAAWDSDQEDSPSNEAKPSPAIAPAGEVAKNSPERNRLPMEEDRRHSSFSTPTALEPPEDDDPAEAWGWGDDDAAEETAVESEELQPPATLYPERREVTLSEKYWTSSTPQPILQAVIGVLNDGATLMQPKFVLTRIMVKILAN